MASCENRRRKSDDDTRRFRSGLTRTITFVFVRTKKTDFKIRFDMIFETTRICVICFETLYKFSIAEITINALNTRQVLPLPIQVSSQSMSEIEEISTIPKVRILEEST